MAALFRQHPFDNFRTPPSRRLALSVLAALTFHAFILALPRPPAERALRTASPLTLQWRTPASSIAPETHAAANALQGENGKTPAPASPRSAPASGEQGGPDARPSPPTSAELLESARRYLRQGPQRLAAQPAPAEERPLLPALDRALRRQAAREEHLTDGSVRITTASGTRYCLNPPPDAARGGPLDPLAVPSICP